MARRAADMRRTGRRRRRLRGFLACCAAPLWVAAAGCVTRPSPPAAAAAAASSELPIPTPWLRDVAREAGLNYRWTIPGERPFNLLQTIGNGCAFLDYDGDGNLDILLVGRTPALFRGDGGGRFRDVSASTGMRLLTGHFLGCAVGDYDNDGDPDIYLSAYRGGALLRNEGGRLFRNATRQSGLKAQPWGTSAAFADINADGALDLYVCNYVVFGPGIIELCRYNGWFSACSPTTYFPERGVLYLGDGEGGFRDVTSSWGASVATGNALGVAVADYDGSGRQSIAIANDELAGDLLQNQGKRFVNAGKVSSTAFDAQGRPHGGMGIDWGDYDNDGRLDLVVTTFRNEAKCVYRNEGGGLFTERSGSLGLADALPFVAFGTKWADVDNDGWLDLLIANGHVQDTVEKWDKDATYLQPTQFFHNQRGRSLKHASDLIHAVARRPILGRGLAVGDYDNDGRVDILVVDSEGSPLLLHNEAPASGHWLQFDLRGVQSNRDGTGALVIVEAEGRRLTRRCGADCSYLSSSDRRVHFGIGEADKISRVEVRWPNGKRDVIAGNVPVNSIYRITERKGITRMPLGTKRTQKVSR